MVPTGEPTNLAAAMQMQVSFVLAADKQIEPRKWAELIRQVGFTYKPGRIAIKTYRAEEILVELDCEIQRRNEGMIAVVPTSGQILLLKGKEIPEEGERRIKGVVEEKDGRVVLTIR